ncbi:protein tesmin/TSO1-like CXC 3 [Mangifera indica]|uniref:protein tesmin/TSO1-like CXC 3 n=1 Tax=Mangifera indica TaxID=29780 RepID=UPI001CF9CC8E|nr:protein tesmin/TSO1-like CXC 3 [Mangifera indica]
MIKSKMDTPEKTTQIATQLSKFEDSPVFNYINSLSPIKPVKSIPVTQTFNSLNFASLPSIFTSPHVSSHKETRFLRRNNCSDLSKPGLVSENGTKACANEGVATDASQLYDNSAQLEENFDPGVSIAEVSIEASGDSKFAIELPRALKFDCGSPGCEPTPCGIETNSVSELTSASLSIVPFTREASEKVSSEGEIHLHGTSNIEQKKEAAGCDWESLMSDASDLLIFNFPDESEVFKGLIHKSMDPGARFGSSVISRFPQSDFSGEPNMQMVDPNGSCQQYEMEAQSTQPGENNELQEINQMQDDHASDDLHRCLGNDLSKKEGDKVGMKIPAAFKPISNLHRGMLRRCLDFELVARRKNLNDGSSCSSSVMLQSDERFASEDTQLVPLKPSNDSPRRILPGIGLHLNALAITSQDNTNTMHETLSSGRQLSLPSSTASFHSPKSSQDPLHESLTSASTERDMVAVENGVPLAEDASQTSGYLVSEDFNQNSPKKKRRRLENVGETESCKRCNCKKSKCLKLYCECFAAGVYCIEPCSCQDCFNKPIHEDTVLATRKQIESRNPLAFAPKVIRSSDSLPDPGDESSNTPASARHKRGCNCKKSSCLKKYCECYQGGVGCSINCRCEGCKNAFGRKDGSILMETEGEPEEDETETYKKSSVDKNLQKSEIPNNEDQNPGSALPTTPLQFCRSIVQLPFSSKCKPPRSLLSIGSSSGFYTGNKYGKPNILRSQSKFEKSLQTAPEDEMPEILQGNCSPSGGIKTASPNSKRVSPPNSVFGSSPSRRSGRKLILQSIPSFPSLTPQH